MELGQHRMPIERQLKGPDQPRLRPQIESAAAWSRWRLVACREQARQRAVGHAHEHAALPEECRSIAQRFQRAIARKAALPRTPAFQLLNYAVRRCHSPRTGT